MDNFCIFEDDCLNSQTQNWHNSPAKAGLRVAEIATLHRRFIRALARLAEFREYLNIWLVNCGCKWNCENAMVRIVRKTIISIFLICLAVFSEGHDCNANQVLSTNSPFVHYLENPPWITEAQFERSQLFARAAMPGRKPQTISALITYRGAVQPGGFYFEILTPMPQGFGPQFSKHGRRIGGISQKYFWGAFYDDTETNKRNITLIPRRLEDGASDQNSEQNSIKYHYLKYFQAVRFYGLPEIEPNSFKIGEFNQFNAIALDGSLLTGKVLNTSDDRIRQLVYVTSASSGDSFFVTYKYRRNAELPDYFEVKELRNNACVEAVTNWIEHVDYGLDSMHTHGYSPNMFFPQMSAFKHVLMWSNGVEYALASNQMIAVIETPYRPLPDMPFASPGMATAMRVFLALTFFVPLCIIWLLNRRKKQNIQ